MNKITQLLTGTKILAENDSPYNGHVRVVRDLAWGTYIQADGLTQTGGVVQSIWKTTIKEIRDMRYEIRSCLILGLGGGTVAKLIRKYYPDTKITGVDIDPIFIEYGKKYFGLDELSIQTVVDDAYAFIKKTKDKYDLIIIDVYQGRDVPEGFDTPAFVRKVSSLLDESGVVVFNRLYYGDKRPIAMRFLKTLEKEFKTVDPIYPQANVMFICSK